MLAHYTDLEWFMSHKLSFHYSEEVELYRMSLYVQNLRKSFLNSSAQVSELFRELIVHDRLFNTVLDILLKHTTFGTKRQPHFFGK